MTSLRVADRIVCPSRVPTVHRPRPPLGRPRCFPGHRAAVGAALGAAATAAAVRAPAKKAVPEWEAALRLVEAVNQLRGSDLAQNSRFFLGVEKWGDQSMGVMSQNWLQTRGHELHK